VTKFLLVTDLDNTLIGDDTALQTFNEKIEQHRINFGSLLIYSTGRSLLSYRDLQTQKNLLEPDALIVSVGTEIYLEGGNNPEPEWSERLQRQWNRAQVLDTVDQVADLSLQPDLDQGAFKVSFSVDQDTAVAVIPQLEAALQAQALATKIIYSAGQHLDILPQLGDKGEAMQFLRQKWQISAFRTAVCGDSGNDISLFKTGAERGIVVGNAQPELRQWHEQNPVNHHYLAQDHCAAGILEGLHHFRFLP
jgi:sucrose-6-phosphatase